MNLKTYRRNIIKAGVVLGGGLSNLSSLQASASYPINHENTLVNIFLAGGPDFRYLLSPLFSTNENDFGNRFWKKRSALFSVSPSNAQLQALSNSYLRTSFNGVQFGIHPNAVWLKEQFDAGNVAIINNVVASESRNHSLATKVWQTGHLGIKPNDPVRNAWAGALARLSNKNILSMTRTVQPFCFSADGLNNDATSQVLSGLDMRNFGLYVPDAYKKDPASRSAAAVIHRSLKNYYAAKAKTMPETSPYYKFIQHEKRMRAFGNAVQNRLAQIAVPSDIEAIQGNGSDSLNNTSFAKQLKNTYDAFTCSDVINLKMCSLSMGGWDSHANQKSKIDPKFSDLFGKGKGLDVLMSSIKNTMPEAYGKTVLMISGEFGRQLAANGDEGTDHGKGNSVLLIGKPVKGGIYGDMFPHSEIEKFDKRSSDIKGLTSVEHVYARMADWMQTGSQTQLFPSLNSAKKERGLDLSQLLA